MYSRVCGILSLPSLHWVRHADDILPRRGKTLRQLLKKQGLPAAPEKPDLLYLPSFEAQYADAELARAVLCLLQDKTPHILLGTPSGLFEYIYGDASLSLLQAKNILSAWEKLGGKRKLPLVTDSIEIYGFLKK